MPSDFIIAHEIVSANRATRSFPKPKPSNPAAQLGLRFERTVGREFNRHLTIGNISKLEHNPWFTYHNPNGTFHCSPDFLLYDDRDRITIVEVKLTWVVGAQEKLQSLYGPVVSLALGRPVRYLVVCKSLVPGAPKAGLSFSDAIDAHSPLLLWPPSGHLRW